MIDKHRAGVDVRGVFEKRGSDTSYSQYPKMKNIGIPVKQDTNRWILHHKVIIIDGETVITGSFNFSNNAATTNEENILIISGNHALAQVYLDEVARVYGDSVSVLRRGYIETEFSGKIRFLFFSGYLPQRRIYRVNRRCHQPSMFLKHIHIESKA